MTSFVQLGFFFTGFVLLAGGIV
nr:hypothetical protein [Priestia megaterium]